MRIGNKITIIILILCLLLPQVSAIPSYFSNPVPSQGQEDVTITAKGVQTCIDVSVPQGCTANVTLQWFNYSDYIWDWIWCFFFGIGCPVSRTEDQYWTNYSSQTINQDTTVCGWNSNVSCSIYGYEYTYDWRVVADFDCGQQGNYQQIAYYDYSTEECSLFYIYPNMTQSNVCPCCDHMCVGINNELGHNMNITIYRSSDAEDVYSRISSWCKYNDEDSNYRRKITIDHDFVDENMVGFPILINLSNDIVSKSDGGDSLRFYDSSCNLLPHEIDYWSTYGLVWVNISSLSSSSDTEIYVYYNDSDATNLEDAEGVWDSNFVGVWHMNDVTSSSIDGVTSNNYDLTKKGANTPNEVSGRIGNAQDFADNDYAYKVNTAPLQIEDAITINILFKPKTGIEDWKRLFDKDVSYSVQRKNGNYVYGYVYVDSDYRNGVYCYYTLD